MAYAFRGDTLWESAEDIPSGTLDPESPLHVGIVGWHNIRRKNWPNLGKHPTWNVDDWPVPNFRNFDDIFEVERVELFDGDLNRLTVRGCLYQSETEGLFEAGTHSLTSLQAEMELVFDREETY